jgi:hypothetical protein
MKYAIVCALVFWCHFLLSSRQQDSTVKLIQSCEHSALAGSLKKSIQFRVGDFWTLMVHPPPVVEHTGRLTDSVLWTWKAVEKTNYYWLVYYVRNCPYIRVNKPVEEQRSRSFINDHHYIASQDTMHSSTDCNYKQISVFLETFSFLTKPLKGFT